MATSSNPEDRYLEVVFSGRNKSYGAYQMRSNYDKQLSAALLIGSGFLIILSAFPSFFNRLEKKISSPRPEVVINLEDFGFKPVLPKDLPPVTLTKPSAASIKFTVPKIVPDPVASEEYIPTQEELSGKNPGTVNNEGTPGAIDPDVIPVEVKKVPVELPVEPVPAETPVNFVEEMPLFPGGNEALIGYIVANTKYPDMARRVEIEGRVFVSFVVEKDGSISQPAVVKGIGAGCDDEALRVIAAMPKWKPGKQNGNPVRVKVSIPVQFRLR